MLLNINRISANKHFIVNNDLLAVVTMIYAYGSFRAQIDFALWCQIGIGQVNPDQTTGVLFSKIS